MFENILRMISHRFFVAKNRLTYEFQTLHEATVDWMRSTVDFYLNKEQHGQIHMLMYQMW